MQNYMLATVDAFISSQPVAPLRNKEKLNADGLRFQNTLIDIVIADINGTVNQGAVSVSSGKRSRVVHEVARLDEIQLDGMNPVGPYSVRDLALAHTIILEGPNGSGKSSFLSPLRHYQNSKGTALCLDQAGRKVQYSADKVNHSIAFVTSTELMTKIDDLKSALTIAAGVTWFEDLSAVFDTVAKDLRKRKKAPPVPDSWDIRDKFLRSDEKLEEVPRTWDEYIRLGKELDANWTHVDRRSTDHERLANEEKLEPQKVDLIGFSDLKANVGPTDSFEVTLEDCIGPAAKAVEQLKLQTECCDHVIEKFKPAIQGEDSNIKKLNAWFESAIDAQQKLIEARDHYATCREHAQKYVESIESQPDKCPVCEQGIDSEELLIRLKQCDLQLDPCLSDDPVAEQLKSLRTEREELNKINKRVEDSIKEASDLWSRNKKRVETVSENLESMPSGWDERVRKASYEIRQMCDQWLEEHGKWSIDAESATLQLKTKIQITINQIDTEIENSNKELRNRKSLFSTFQELGSLLWMRRDLNENRWVSDPQQESLNLRHDGWADFLQNLSSSYRDKATNAVELLLTDNVLTRFQRMIERMKEAGHPGHVVGATMRGNVVVDSTLLNDKDTKNGTTVINDRISEGQRVLINCAARLTCASVVVGHENHKPSWIVFDEPTNGLDPEATVMLADYLGSFSTGEVGAQIIVSTFDQAFAKRLRISSLASNRSVRHIVLERFNRVKHPNGLRPVTDNNYVPTAPQKPVTVQGN
jgi:DNA repair exonuclease SbcCD ATPase subunit